MKGEILFEKMTGISDEYIAEAALVKAKKHVSPHKKRFVPYLLGGLAAACICCAVTVTALTGIVIAGYTSGLVGSTSTPSFSVIPDSPLWQRFEFSFSITDGEGQPLQSFTAPGDTVLVDTTLTNKGLPFFYTGSSSEFCAYAEFVLQGNESVTIPGGIFHTTDAGTFPVLSGETGEGQYFFTIPEDAIPGVYDLVLSYKDARQVFSGILIVGDPTGETQAPVDSRFFFGYEPIDGFATPGGSFTVPTWVNNHGEAFVYEGASNGYAPNAALVHMDTGYRIESALPVTGDWVTFTIQTGQRGERTQTFLIPADAPTGAYALELSYGGATKSFARAVIVGSDVDDAALSFSFGYDPLSIEGFTVPDAHISIRAWVINRGEAFYYEGSSNGFTPQAVLIHTETGYSIEGVIAVSDDYDRFTIQPGHTGACSPIFHIPANAPTGEYALSLSYCGYKQIFENVLTVAIP